MSELKKRLDPVPPDPAEQKHRPHLQRIQLILEPNERNQPVNPLAHVGSAGQDDDLFRSGIMLKHL